MIASWKEYYQEVCKPSFKWMKRHWKGLSVYIIIIGLAPYVWVFRNEIVDYIDSVKSKFMKKEEP